MGSSKTNTARINKTEYVRTDAEQADFEERNAGPTKRNLRAAYYGMIGEAPVLGPADHAGAIIYLDKIRKALARGRWTRSERTRLVKLHLKWERRATGADAYFEVYGNRRQWADHGDTKNKQKYQLERKVDQGIKEVIRQEVVRQKGQQARKETEDESQKRQAAVGRIRAREETSWDDNGEDE